MQAQGLKPTKAWVKAVDDLVGSCVPMVNADAMAAKFHPAPLPDSVRANLARHDAYLERCRKDAQSAAKRSRPRSVGHWHGTWFRSQKNSPAFVFVPVEEQGTSRTLVGSSAWLCVFTFSNFGHCQRCSLSGSDLADLDQANCNIYRWW